MDAECYFSSILHHNDINVFQLGSFNFHKNIFTYTIEACITLCIDDSDKSDFKFKIKV